jgi:hypothetical protein
VHSGIFAGVLNFFDPACKTQDAAARAALTEVRKELGVRQYEYGGEIVPDRKGGYRYTGPNGGQKASVGVDLANPDVTAGYHNHPPLEGYDAEHFSTSPGDKQVSDDAQKSSYLLTPTGRILRYDPDPAREQNGPVTQIGQLPPYNQ